MDGDQLFDPILGEQDSNHRKLKTVPFFSFHLFVSTLISLIGVILAAAWPADQRCKAYYVMMYLRVGFWVLTFLFDHLVKWIHEQHRLVGYLDMHRNTRMIRGTPLIIVSAWSVVLMGIQTLMHQYYGENFGEHCATTAKLNPAFYVTMFSVVETIVLGCVHGSYIAKVRHFNAIMPLPDALREGNETSRRSVGFTSRGAGIVELLDKQADLIEYYKDQLDRTMQSLVQANSSIRVRLEAANEGASTQ